MYYIGDCYRDMKGGSCNYSGLGFRVAALKGPARVGASTRPS